MELVKRIIRGRTNVWAPDWVVKKIWDELGSEKAREAFATKIDGFARHGFADVSDRFVRHEGNPGGGETWRLGYKNSDLFRVVGFFEDDTKRDFIALDAFYKDSDKGYSKSQRNRMKEISHTKREGESAWQKLPT